MRHRNAGRKLGRSSSHRRAMLRNMVTSLFEHERIQTTDAKAKEVRRVAEKCITLGKRGGLHARRQALSLIRSKAVVAKLFDEISPRFAERPGGYTRILKLGNRKGDNAPVSILELVQEAYTPRPKKRAPAGKAKKAKAEAPEAPQAAPVPEEAEAPAEAADEATPVEGEAAATPGEATEDETRES